MLAATPSFPRCTAGSAGLSGSRESGHGLRSARCEPRGSEKSPFRSPAFALHKAKAIVGASPAFRGQRRELVEPAKMHVAAERTQVPVVRAVPVVINREVRASWAEAAWVDLAPSAAT
jgi:hypothetical protein